MALCSRKVVLGCAEVLWVRLKSLYQMLCVGQACQCALGCLGCLCKEAVAMRSFLHLFFDAFPVLPKTCHSCLHCADENNNGHVRADELGPTLAELMIPEA